jgi:hypothetical protein
LNFEPNPRPAALGPKSSFVATAVDINPKLVSSDNPEFAQCLPSLDLHSTALSVQFAEVSGQLEARLAFTRDLLAILHSGNRKPIPGSLMEGSRLLVRILVLSSLKDH